MKFCISCKIEKNISAFHKKTSAKDGHCSYCKECAYIKNKEWNQENKDKVAAQHKRTYKKHKEARLLNSKIWREKNPEKKKAGVDKWKKEHPYKNREYLAKRKSRKLKNGGTLTAIEINKLIEDSNNTCFWCDCDIEKGEMHLDHIYPLAKGGENNINNLVVSCKICNLKKHDKNPEVFMEEILKSRVQS